MTRIINKIIFLFFMAGVSLLFFSPAEIVLSTVLAIAFSGIMEYFEKASLNLFLFILYLVLCIFYPMSIYYLPLMGYDLFLTRNQSVLLLSILPVLFRCPLLKKEILYMMIFSVLAEIVLIFSTNRTNAQKLWFKNQRDILEEKSLQLEGRLKELSLRQDEEVTIATLNERNRIAREIHDNVGHMLSRSILQIGALIATTNDSGLKESLSSIHSTLDDSMNAIRISVHDLRDQSIDLEAKLKEITDEYTFCPATLEYKCNTSLNIKAKYAVISIVREALNNTAVHSNATRTEIRLLEHTGLIQLIISDNGTTSTGSRDCGIGLESMQKRVNELRGNLNIQSEKGYRIFISFQKEYVV